MKLYYKYFLSYKYVYKNILSKCALQRTCMKKCASSTVVPICTVFYVEKKCIKQALRNLEWQHRAERCYILCLYRQVIYTSYRFIPEYLYNIIIYLYVFCLSSANTGALCVTTGYVLFGSMINYNNTCTTVRNIIYFIIKQSKQGISNKI